MSRCGSSWRDILRHHWTPALDTNLLRASHIPNACQEKVGHKAPGIHRHFSYSKKVSNQPPFVPCIWKGLSKGTRQGELMDTTRLGPHESLTRQLKSESKVKERNRSFLYLYGHHSVLPTFRPLVILFHSFWKFWSRKGHFHHYYYLELCKIQWCPPPARAVSELHWNDPFHSHKDSIWTVLPNSKTRLKLPKRAIFKSDSDTVEVLSPNDLWATRQDLSEGVLIAGLQ